LLPFTHYDKAGHRNCSVDRNVLDLRCRAVTGPRLLTIIAVGIAAMTVAILTQVSPLDIAAHTLVRWTARTSLALFTLAFAARPAVVLWPRPRTKRLLAERKWLGLGFATSHAAHLAGIVIIASPDFGAFIRAQPPTNAVAALTFLLLFAMAFTSIDRVRRAMPATAWKALHRTGMYFAWLAFTATYAGAIGASPAYVLPTAVLVGVVGMRVAVLVRRGRRERSLAS
jgi:DMSO/TMAO reductase YedYZ heme-binding membrane subunit